MSGDEIQKYCRKALVMTYPVMLECFKRGYDILQLLPMILLYEFEPHTGHWVLLFERRGHVEFFDPLGFVPDTEDTFIPPAFASSHGEDKGYLLQALRGIPVEYNEIDLQKESPNIATCGRWCVLRLAWKNKSLEWFQKTFSFPGADAVVADIVP